MNQKFRVLIAVGIIILLTGAVVGLEFIRGQRVAAQIDASLQPGDIPIFWNGNLRSAFSPTDLESIPSASFVDSEEGKTQDGWLLKDILMVYFNENQFKEDTIIKVISTSREKSIELTWLEVANPENMVMFDLSGRGTLKLVSLLERLDTRDEWIQDVDKLEIITK
ncbi:MAG: hypothetical protein Q7U53_01720 [Anaerolineaceae bacterium]|nr:hypothetical protein [Anaerolineaceae bacterium]